MANAKRPGIAAGPFLLLCSERLDLEIHTAAHAAALRHTAGATAAIGDCARMRAGEHANAGKFGWEGEQHVMLSRSIRRSGQPTLCHRIVECAVLTGT